eukprot:6176150-Pleurochrysis_carterae.AAC.1
MSKLQTGEGRAVAGTTVSGCVLNVARSCGFTRPVSSKRMLRHERAVEDERDGKRVACRPSRTQPRAHTRTHARTHARIHVRTCTRAAGAAGAAGATANARTRKHTLGQTHAHAQAHKRTHAHRRRLRRRRPTPLTRLLSHTCCCA